MTKRGTIWERPVRASRGPVPSLSRKGITDAAIAMADANGIHALSMRALAEGLDVGAASLYRYVDSKDELIDLMVDAVLGDDLHFTVEGDWRSDLRAYGLALRAMQLRHPWMAVQGADRSTLGPNAARQIEQVLGAVDNIGLDVDRMALMVQTIVAYVRGHTLEEISEQEAIRRSGLDREEYMLNRAPYAQSLLDNGMHPLLSRVINGAPTADNSTRLRKGFDNGLELVLEGLATLISR